MANQKAAPTPTEFQAGMIAALTRKQGATRPEMQAASGAKTMPNAFFLDRMAKRYGYDCYADYTDRTDLLVYQFVRPGKKPTAY
jgi:hypothetical protein